MITIPSKQKDFKWFHKVAVLFTTQSFIVLFCIQYVGSSLLIDGVKRLVQHKMPDGVDFLALICMSLFLNVRVSTLFSSSFLDIITLLPAAMYIYGLVQHNYVASDVGILMLSSVFLVSTVIFLIILWFGKEEAEE